MINVKKFIKLNKVTLLVILVVLLVFLIPITYSRFENKLNTNAKIDDRVVREEKEQLQALKLEYYKLGFVSKTGFNISNPNDYILISLNDIYGETR